DRQQDAHDDTHWYDQGVGDQSHGRTGTVRRARADAASRASSQASSQPSGPQAGQPRFKPPLMAPRAAQAADRLGSKRNLQMTQDERTVLRVFGLFLLAQFSLVYCDGARAPPLSQPAAAKCNSGDKSKTVKEQASTPAPLPQVHYGTDALPRPVEEVREAILSAVRSGRIEDLRYAWDLNELKPDLGVAASDPIVHWKQIS